MISTPSGTSRSFASSRSRNGVEIGGDALERFVALASEQEPGGPR